MMMKMMMMMVVVHQVLVLVLVCFERRWRRRAWWCYGRWSGRCDEAMPWWRRRGRWGARWPRSGGGGGGGGWHASNGRSGAVGVGGGAGSVVRPRYGTRLAKARMQPLQQPFLRLPSSGPLGGGCDDALCSVEFVCCSSDASVMASCVLLC